MQRVHTPIAVAAFAALTASMTVGCRAVPGHAPATAAAEAEVRQVVDAVCAWVSGPKGKTLDRAALLALFVPDGRMAVAMTQPDGSNVAQSMSVAAFADLVVRDAAERAFYETPLRTRVQVFGGIAAAWSSYEARMAPDQPPFERGINSFQLVRTAAGWRIVSVAWHLATDAIPLPSDMAGG
jgi:hypothetical protein